LERVLSVILIALIVCTIAWQTSSLYVFPMPDSARWWGDETGQIVELKAELHDGYAHIPIGLGSTVAVTNGIVRGNSWLAAIVYGLPALIFSSIADLVSIGRTVTIVLSIGLLLFLYVALRKFNVDRVVSLFAILLLVSTRSFFFASHAARLDVAAGFALVAVVYYLATRFEKWRLANCSPDRRWFFLLGASMLLLATLSIHLLTLLAPIGVLALYHFGAFRKVSFLLAALSGVSLVALILFGVYFISGAPVTLFGTTQLHTQFHSVIDEIPITKITSPNAQIGNLLARFEGLIAEAPAVFVLLMSAVLLLIVRIKHFTLSLAERFALQAFALVCLSWLLLESYAIYYYMQVLPLIVVVSVLLIVRSLSSKLVFPASRIAIALTSLVVFYFAISDALRAHAAGAMLTSANEQALDRMTRGLPSTNDVILTQNPALAWLLFHTDLKVMSPHFLEFPLSEKAPTEVMREQHVRYILSYADPQQRNFSFEVVPMKHATDSLGELIATERGILLDVNRNYFTLDTTRVDTINLYRIKW
jgi:MFS family permease